ncbi:hypothetical protein SteCoe_5478 [Stentor coeruleus]|uniref:Uncharacterized protein n=1 Tax=Stentor coeruleus TaxID=5963 RepID=A0A1R2CSC3_9CILI|nr:hypothetical protein SteCoe_5478 [Stentor coeruleus]
MKARIFIGPYDHRCVWIAIIILLLGALSLLIGSIFTPIWATTTKNEFGLYTCNTPCSKDNYKDLKTLVCSQELFIQEYSEDESIYLYQSGCLLFKNLESAFYLYSIFATATGIFTTIWIFSIITFCSRRITYYCGLFFSLLTFISQASGSALWIIFSNTSLTKCPDFPDDGTAPVLCESTGVRLSLASGIFYGLIFIGYVLVGRSAKKGLSAVNDDTNYFKPSGVVSPDNDKNVRNAWDE